MSATAEADLLRDTLQSQSAEANTVTFSSMRQHFDSISLSNEPPQSADQVRDSRISLVLVSQSYLTLAGLFLFRIEDHRV